MLQALLVFTGTSLVGGSNGTLQITGWSGGGIGQLEFYKGLSNDIPEIIINYDSRYNGFSIMDFGFNNSFELMFSGDMLFDSNGDIDFIPWGRLYYHGDEVATQTWCY